MPLDPVRQDLLNLVGTQYRDVLTKISNILAFVDAQSAALRAGLIGDTLCWWNLIPMESEHVNATLLPFTSRQRTEAATTLEALIERQELNPDDAFEQGLPPDKVGALVLTQIGKAGVHGTLIQLEFFFRVLSGNFVPYVGHVSVSDTDPVTNEEMYAAARAHTEELLAMEVMYQSPNRYSALSAWAVGLATRTDQRTARLLIGYSIGRLMVLTRAAMKQMMAERMPMMLRISGQPPGDAPPDDESGGDPKKAN